MLSVNVRMFVFVLACLLTACNSCDSTHLTDVGCNKQLNDGCECINGADMRCGTNVGLCRVGTVTCVNGRFPACTPAVSPSDEQCDGLDHNCNGEVYDIADKGQPCWTGNPSAVFSDTSTHSICQRGTWACDQAQKTKVCAGQVGVAESFDPEEKNVDCNKDNNCNGVVGDVPEDQRACETVRGECRPKIWTCVHNDKKCVDGPNTRGPRPELCNGLDDDCDGVVDNFDEYCGTLPAAQDGVGICQRGKSRCVSGQPGPCMGEVLPQTGRECNNIDLNCDGRIDNTGCQCNPGDTQTCKGDLIRTTTTSTGGIHREIVHCGWGERDCDDNGRWGDCIWTHNRPERCNGYLDDCRSRSPDGSPWDDELLTKTCGVAAHQSLPPPCRAGTQWCRMVNNQWDWTPCDAVDPQPEICNNRDDDCNGVIDDGFPRGKVADILILVDCSGSMCPYITGLTQATERYVNGFASCTRTSTHTRFALGRFPSANYPSESTEYIVPFTDAQTFVQHLQFNVGCFCGGLEPSYNACFEPTTFTDAWNPIGWRHSVRNKIIIEITDEEAQWLPGRPLTKMQVASAVANCQLPGCMPGDRIQVYVITHLVYPMSLLTAASMWDDVVGGDLSHIKEISPGDAADYLVEFDQIFQQQQVCGQTCGP